MVVAHLETDERSAVNGLVELATADQLAAADEAEAAASRVHFQLFADASGQGIRWRLLSGNRREIGRSVLSYPDTSQCGSGIDWMRTHLSDLMTRIQRSDSGGWSWELLYEDEAIVMSGRRFDRQIRCVQALSLFRELAPEAVIHATVMLAHARRGAGDRVRLGAALSTPSHRTGARR